MLLIPAIILSGSCLLLVFQILDLQPGLNQIVTDAVQLPLLLLQLRGQLLRLVLGFKIVVRQVHAEHQLPLIAALFPVVFRIVALGHFLVDIDCYLMQILLAFVRR